MQQGDFSTRCIIVTLEGWFRRCSCLGESVKIRRRIIIMITILISVPLFNFYIVFTANRQVDENLSWVNHTHVVLLEAEKLSASLLKLQLLAEQKKQQTIPDNVSAKATELDTQIQNIIHNHSQLVSLTDDNPVQQQLLRHVKVELERLVKWAQVEEASRYDELYQLSKHTLLHLTELKKHEYQLLDGRSEYYAESRYTFKLLFIGTIVMLVVSGLGLLYLINWKLLIPIKTLINNTYAYCEVSQVNDAGKSHSDDLYSLSRNIEALYHSSKEREHFYKQKAAFDSLTGLRNRFTLICELNAALEEAINKKQLMAVLYVDLNKLKQINDVMGHAAGDAALQEAANRLTMNVRQSDIVFRVGGDEFIVLFKNFRSPRDLDLVIESIQNAFTPHALIGDKLVTLSVSMGIAYGPDDSDDPQEIISCADRAMYYAKCNKLKQCHAYSHALAQVNDREGSRTTE